MFIHRWHLMVVSQNHSSRLHSWLPLIASRIINTWRFSCWQCIVFVENAKRASWELLHSEPTAHWLGWLKYMQLFGLLVTWYSPTLWSLTNAMCYLASGKWKTWSVLWPWSVSEENTIPWIPGFLFYFFIQHSNESF